MSITQQPAPPDSLLMSYRGGARPERWGQYGDCFSVNLKRRVTLEEFVSAFYTTWVFKIERRMLRWVMRAASTDAQARGVAAGTQDAFAIWRVGARTETQLLMCDRYESTRSWFRVAPIEGGTLLQFGSAVAAARGGRGGGRGGGGTASMGGGFQLLLGFHVLYSKVLLRAAATRLMAQTPGLKPP
jgi:hypothetical protein